MARFIGYQRGLCFRRLLGPRWVQHELSPIHPPLYFPYHPPWSSSLSRHPHLALTIPYHHRLSPYHHRALTEQARTHSFSASHPRTSIHHSPGARRLLRSINTGNEKAWCERRFAAAFQVLAVRRARWSDAALCNSLTHVAGTLLSHIFKWENLIAPNHSHSIDAKSTNVKPLVCQFLGVVFLFGICYTLTKDIPRAHVGRQEGEKGEKNGAKNQPR